MGEPGVEVAPRWRVRPETVTAWELGHTRPSVRRLPTNSAFLGDEAQPPAETLPERLLAIRRRLGLTQAELAARLGQDEHQICRWERGRLKPHPWLAGRVELTLLTLEGRPANKLPAPLSFFDLTRWRRKPPKGVAVIPATFGERLRAHRLECGLSMEDLGQRVKVSRGTIYRLERGKQAPSVELRMKLDHALA